MIPESKIASIVSSALAVGITLTQFEQWIRVAGGLLFIGATLYAMFKKEKVK